MARGRMLKNSGYVYIMLAPDGRYKIGEAIDVDNRRKKLEREFGFPMSVIRSVITIDRFSEEARFHGKFCHKRQEREWFTLDQNDIAEFDELAPFIEKQYYAVTR